VAVNEVGMYSDRVDLYEKLENMRQTKIITYFTSDRRGFETQIAQDVIDLFIDQLDEIGVVKKYHYFCIHGAGIQQQLGISLIC
jgi:hypothetical protein